MLLSHGNKCNSCFQAMSFEDTIFCEHQGCQLIPCFSSSILNGLGNYPLPLSVDGKGMKLFKKDKGLEENGELCM